MHCPAPAGTRLCSPFPVRWALVVEKVLVYSSVIPLPSHCQGQEKIFTVNAWWGPSGSADPRVSYSHPRPRLSPAIHHSGQFCSYYLMLQRLLLRASTSQLWLWTNLSLQIYGYDYSRPGFSVCPVFLLVRMGVMTYKLFTGRASEIFLKSCLDVAFSMPLAHERNQNCARFFQKINPVLLLKLISKLEFMRLWS